MGEEERREPVLIASARAHMSEKGAMGKEERVVLRYLVSSRAL